MEKVRLNLVLPKDIRDYLKERAFEKSTPEHTVSMTEYLIGLVENDRRRTRV